MRTYLNEGSVRITDPSLSSTLLNKGSFGRPLKGGGLDLELIEAAFLVGAGRIEVGASRDGPKVELKDLIELGVRTRDRFLEHLLVYRDLRNRGLIAVEEVPGELMVHPRGKRPTDSRPEACFLVHRETDSTDLHDLLSRTKRLKREGLRTVVSVVDGDWDITHYEVKEALRPKKRGIKGRTIISPPVPTSDLPGGGAISSTDQRPDSGPASLMGTDLDGVLLLSCMESSLLRGWDAKPDEGSVSFRSTVYADLLSREWLPRTGFKYGTHFRVYTSGTLEGHSEMLVHCLVAENNPSWEELSRAIRLSHSVKKRMVFSLAEIGDDGGISPIYIEIEWTRP